jgi:hypothetical protein
MGLSGVIGLKTTQWLTISRLGFKSEVPAGYLQHPNIYHNVSTLLFLILIFVPIFLKSIPLWVIVLVVFEWFAVAIKGRESAIKIYRNIIKEMVSEDPCAANDILKKTDAEIWNELVEKERLMRRP